MSITRVCKLDGFPQIVYGRDFNNVFEEGAVYNVRNINGEIIFTKIGEHAKMENFKFLDLETIFMDGNCLLTKEEYEFKLSRF